MEEALRSVVEPGFSLVAVGFFFAGVIGIFLVLVFVVNGDPYGKASGPLSPAEMDEARREVGRRFSDLAPRMLLLAERLRSVDAVLARGDLDDERWLRVERLTREAPAAGAWRRYSDASALADEQPLMALEELREVEWMVETALSKLGTAQRLCNVEERT